MKQPKIRITNIHGKVFGVKKVVQLIWDSNSELVEIKVDFLGEHRDLMVMYDIDHTGEFINPHGNLKGRLVGD